MFSLFYCGQIQASFSPLFPVFMLSYANLSQTLASFFLFSIMSDFSVCPFCPSGSKDEMFFFTHSWRSKLQKSKLKCFLFSDVPQRVWNRAAVVESLINLWKCRNVFLQSEFSSNSLHRCYWLVLVVSLQMELVHLCKYKARSTVIGGGGGGSCGFPVIHVARQQHTKPTSPSICHACKSVGSSLTRRRTMHMPSPQEHVQPSASTSDSYRRKKIKISTVLL